MDGQLSFWQFGDELRGQSKVSEDHQWFMAATKLAEQTRFKGERMNNLELSKSPSEIRLREKPVFHEDNKYENIDFNLLSLGSKVSENLNRTNSYSNSAYNMNSVYQKGSSNNNNVANFNAMVGNKFIHNYFNNKESTTNDNNNTLDKRFKTLPSAEMLPRNEVLGGYIFVCNNDTMQEDLKRLLFGLPPRYRDSVRAITPGLPLFLYNYTTHQLHGIFEDSPNVSHLLQRLPGTFPNVRYLMLMDRSTSWSLNIFLSFVEKFPHAETFIWNICQTLPKRGKYWETKLPPSQSIFKCLKRFEMQTSLRTESELKFLEFLFERAVVLEEVTIRQGHGRGKRLVAFKEKLCLLPRASLNLVIRIASRKY